MKIIYIIIILLFSYDIYALKDCPADMVLWRAPGSLQSDCVCPTGQSMVTDIISTSNSHTFGRCSENFIPISRSWAMDIDNSLTLWLDADDPYGNGYRKFTDTTYFGSNWIDKSLSGEDASPLNIHYNVNFNSNTLGVPPAYSMNPILVSGNNGYFTSGLFNNTSHTFFLTVNLKSFVTTKSSLLYFSDARADVDLYIDSSTNQIYLSYKNRLSGSPATIINITYPNFLLKNLIFCFTINGVTNQMQLAIIDSSFNGTLSFTSNAVVGGGSDSNTFPLIIGRSRDNISNFDGYIYEILSYNNVLTNTQILEILKKLDQKWLVY